MSTDQCRHTSEAIAAKEVNNRIVVYQAQTTKVGWPGWCTDAKASDD